MDYERDKRIDLNNLHYEWMMQIQLTHEYESEIARAKAQVDYLEERTKIEEAQAGDRARELLAAKGKYTVDMVRDFVTLDPDLIKWKEDHRKAILDLGLVKAAAKAMDIRRSALEGLVELYKREYFATPHEARDYDKWVDARFTEDISGVLREQANEKAKEAKEAIIRTRTKRS